MTTSLKWHQKPVRMMRLDYVQELDRLLRLDPEQLAREMKERWHVNCEWIIGSPGVAPGTAQYVTFDSAKFEKYPPLGDMDLVKKYLPHARKHGIHVLAYTNMHWFSNQFAAEHPDWLQRLADGTPYGERHPLYGNGTTFCPAGPWREWAMELLGEAMRTGIDGIFLDGPVIFSGCCYCDSCRALFRERYGDEIPAREDWRDPNWRNLVHFREESLAHFLRDAKKTITSVNPEGVIFLNAGNMDGSGWRVARDNAVCAPYQDFNGAECFYHPGNDRFALHAWSMLAKYLTAEDIPAVVFSHHALGSWHYLPLPELESEISIAQTVANGANPWIAVFVHALDADKERAIRPIDKMNGFIEKHEDYFTATESAADVAVVLSRQTYNFYVSDLPGIYGARGTGVEQGLSVDIGKGAQLKPEEWQKRKTVCEGMLDAELRGTCYALLRNHVAFDIILDRHLTTESLGRYRVVILPGTACLGPEQTRAIRAYIESGGSCVGSFELGCFDEQGNPVGDMLLLRTFGVDAIEGTWQPPAFEEYLKVRSEVPEAGALLRKGALLPRPEFALKVRAAAGVADAPVIFMNRVGGLYTALKGESEYPAVVAGRHGAGRTVYFPHLLGEAYWKLKTAEHEQLLMGCLKGLLGYRPPVRTDAPPTVEIEWRRQTAEGRHLLHVVNMTGDMQRPITHIAPLTDVAFDVSLRDAERVSVLGKEALSFTQTADGIAFKLPRLETYAVICIE